MERSTRDEHVTRHGVMLDKKVLKFYRGRSLPRRTANRLRAISYSLGPIDNTLIPRGSRCPACQAVALDQEPRGSSPQAKTPAVSCMRALTSPRWCSVSPKLISIWVSFLK